ncbi:unnamed protein product [Rhizophagus irregularis]|nr:unnamed protein product [Rhizophagus irregularis]
MFQTEIYQIILELIQPRFGPKLVFQKQSQMILDNGKAGGTINYVASERVCRDIKMRDFFDNGEHLYESVDDEDIKEQ